MTITLYENTLVTVAEADTRLTPLSEKWVAYTDAQKEEWLSQASMILDDNVWLSTAVSATQAMSWPRVAA